MPSDTRFAPDAAGRRRWEWLWSQGLGVLCGQATVLLLAVGSVCLAVTRGGESAAIVMDDIRGFFTAPSRVQLWFYLLLPVLSLYALNTALATWRNVVRRWRNLESFKPWFLINFRIKALYPNLCCLLSTIICHSFSPINISALEAGTFPNRY